MFYNTTFSSHRHQTIETFQELRHRALLATLTARLFGKNVRLPNFTERVPQPVTTRTYLGTQDLPLEKIIGSVGRANDFDQTFRPLKKHLLDRWVEVYQLLETDRLPPIRVYKYGNEYYVEDGHHRVSAARAIGRLTIRAEVWEIPVQAQKEPCKFCLPTGQKKSQALAHA